MVCMKGRSRSRARGTSVRWRSTPSGDVYVKGSELSGVRKYDGWRVWNWANRATPRAATDVRIAVGASDELFVNDGV